MDFIIFVCFSGTQSSTSDWIGKIGSESRSLRSSPYLEVRRGGSDAAERVGAIPRCGPEQRSLWSKYSFGCDCSWCCRGTPRCEASVPFSAEALRVSASSISVICYRGHCCAPAALHGVLSEVSFAHALGFQRKRKKNSAYAPSALPHRRSLAGDRCRSLSAEVKPRTAPPPLPLPTL